MLALYGQRVWAGIAVHLFLDIASFDVEMFAV